MAVTREQRQALHREYAEAVKDLPFLEQMGFRHWCEQELIETREELAQADLELSMWKEVPPDEAREAKKGEA